MHHIVEVPVRGDADVLLDELWIAGAVGIEELPGAVRAAFTDPEAAATIAALHDVRAVEVADHTGLDAWRDHATSIDAGGFTIRPRWLPANPTAIDVLIDPGHAFGSGSHPSTRLALELLSRHLPAGAPRVLDLGCGSGVLAIAAAKLGADVTAIDTDPAAAAAVAANARANGVDSRIRFELADAAGSTGRFDFGLCNMTIDLHEAIGPGLARGSMIDTLVVAGILSGAQEQRAATAHGRLPVDRTTEHEWAALALR